LNSNYSEEIKKIFQNEENKKISNHTVYNFTGRNLKLYKLYKSGRNNVLDDVKYLDVITTGKFKNS